MTQLDLSDGLRLLNEVAGEERFGHKEHLRFAWSLLDVAPTTAEAEHVASITIRHSAESGGNPDKYICTVTLFWIRVLAHIRSDHPRIGLEESFVVFPSLVDPHLPPRHWSDVNDAVAKREWVEPDLIPVP